MELPVEAEREPAAAAEDPLQDGEDKCRYLWYFVSYNLFPKGSDVNEEVQGTEEWKPKIIWKPEERDRFEEGNKLLSYELLSVHNF